MSAKSDEASLTDPQSSYVVQGALEMLILKILALEPMHEQIIQGVFHVNSGSLLPALSRMERAGPRQVGMAGNRE